MISLRLFLFFGLVLTTAVGESCFESNGIVIPFDESVNSTVTCDFKQDACFVFVDEHRPNEGALYGCRKATDGDQLPAECAASSTGRKLAGHLGVAHGKIFCCQSEMCNSPGLLVSSTTMLPVVEYSNIRSRVRAWLIADYFRVPLLFLGLFVVVSLFGLLIVLGVLSSRINQMKDRLDDHVFECSNRVYSMETKSRKEIYEYVDKMARSCVKKAGRKAEVPSTKSVRQSEAKQVVRARAGNSTDLASYLLCYKN